jgi:hypothetical protein
LNTKKSNELSSVFLDIDFMVRIQKIKRSNDNFFNICFFSILENESIKNFFDFLSIS